ncbi:hypothetical protein CF65_01769 [Aggregatibacter actinomycetemcomitans HK1651]|nr:hypothetical protein CF65_01769 [Aggregatibacter actinomycetemcomitans HK1651]
MAIIRKTPWLTIVVKIIHLLLGSCNLCAVQYLAAP